MQSLGQRPFTRFQTIVGLRTLSSNIYVAIVGSNDLDHIHTPSVGIGATDSTIWFINVGEICIYVYSYVTYRNPCNALIYSREHILSSIGNSLRYFLRKLWNPSNKQVSKNRIIYF